MTARCAKCGKSFWQDEDEDWKTLCIPCFKLSKTLERRAELRAEVRALAAENEAANLRGQLRKAHAEIQRFLEMAAARQAEVNALRERARIADGLHEHLPRLRQLCHPDKHGGSVAANNAMQWLNAIRERLH